MSHSVRAKGYFALAAAAVAAVTFGAAGTALSGEKEVDPRLGEEVDRICFSRDIDGFRTIDDEDDAVLLERGVNDWYRAALSGPCNYNALRFAQSVAIDDRPRGGCVTRGDALVFSDSAFGDFRFPNATRCIIVEIHRWDEKAQASGGAGGAEPDADTAD